MNSQRSTREELRQELAVAREELADRFRREGDVGAYLEQHTRLVDQLFCGWGESALPPGVALFALAGYGRARLFPYSDIDLLVVRCDPESVDPTLKSGLQRLWDAGLRLSQQVCTPGELENLELGDWEFLLALRDLRPLWGPEDLIRQVGSMTRSLPPGIPAEALIELVQQSVKERHHRFDDTIYHLEPDLKKGPGGLRDAHILDLVRRLREGPAAAVPEDVIEAENTIGFMRICLHLLAGRDQNRMTHGLQEQVAAMYRPSPPPANAVETVMGEYFRSARRIDSRIRRLSVKKRPDRTAPSSLLNFHQLLNRLLGLLEGGEDAEEAFWESLHDQAGQIARGIVHPLLGGGVLELFRPRAGLFSVLRELHDCGLLVVLFPEFESIQNRVVRDFYHRYTVDEHSLRAIRVAELLASRPDGVDRRFSALLEEVSTPSTLSLSLLLHDIGKGQGGSHSETGASMARRALGRFRFPPAVIADVEFLILHHLSMSSLIQKRDLDDDTVVGKFADLVGHVERLRLLCLHTLCDISAVAPEAMTQWRRDRLWQLYVATYNKLTREYGEIRVSRNEDILALVSGLPDGLPEEEFKLFLEGFPLRYLQSTPADDIYRHFEMALRVTKDNPIQESLTPVDGHYRLCVITRDRRRLFARIAGLISYFEMSIGRGHGFSNRAGLVLDIIEFSDPQGVLARETSQGEGFLEMLRAAILDKLSVRQLLRRKERSVLFRPGLPGFEPRVVFHDSNRGDYTIVELMAPDSLGLLYRIATCIGKLDCNIELVLITTEGRRAIDVFYLTYSGQRLDDWRKSRLQKEILLAISEGGDPAA